tara:strand:+ start:373 stop:519 length:147 start_codon:yes stop_codon:yes gene_type:complete
MVLPFHPCVKKLQKKKTIGQWFKYVGGVQNSFKIKHQYQNVVFCVVVF